LHRGVKLEERDFFAERFSEDELRGLIAHRSTSELFSWNSPSFRKLGLQRSFLDDDQLVAIMLEEPRLIRRPLTFIGGTLVVGAGTEALSRTLS
jgi:arsenate reductase-like glutaredoxin family protein